MNLRFILSFAWITGLASIRRSFSYMLVYMVMPLALLFLFSIISEGALLPYAIIGGLISITAAGALYTLSDAAFYRIELKMQDLLVATPIGPLDYMLGVSIGNLLFSVPGILVYLLIGIFYGIFTLPMLIPILAIVFLLTISTSALAFIISSIPKHIRNVWGFSSIISVIFTLVPPLFYPYTILPKALLYAFMLSPVTSASIMIQNMSGLTPFLWYAVVVLLAETVVYFAIARPLTRWRSI